MHTIGYNLRSRAKDMTITIVIINPRKRAWSVNDVMPGSDGPENLKILKKSQMGSTLDHEGRQLGYLPQWQTVEVESDHGVEKLGSDNDVEKLRLDHEMCRALGCC